jgi:hypothetical protein
MKRSSVFLAATILFLVSSAVPADGISANDDGLTADSSDSFEDRASGRSSNATLNLLIGGLAIVLSGTAFCRWQAGCRPS